MSAITTNLEALTITATVLKKIQQVPK